jgi:hypothetical protein
MSQEGNGRFSCAGVSAFVAALVLASGCSDAPRVHPSETSAIFDAAQALLDVNPSISEIDPAAWPEDLRALAPEAIRSDQLGLYVVTSSRWVEERGIFVPRDATQFSPEPGTDPEYTLVSNAVYLYRIRG